MGIDPARVGLAKKSVDIYALQCAYTGSTGIPWPLTSVSSVAHWKKTALELRDRESLPEQDRHCPGCSGSGVGPR